MEQLTPLQRKKFHIFRFDFQSSLELKAREKRGTRRHQLKTKSSTWISKSSNLEENPEWDRFSSDRENRGRRKIPRTKGIKRWGGGGGERAQVMVNISVSFSGYPYHRAIGDNEGKRFWQMGPITYLASLSECWTHSTGSLRAQNILR